MQYLFSSPDLTAPTFETLQEYGMRRFEKLVRYLPTFPGEPVIRISVHREKYMFVVTVEVTMPQTVFVKVQHEDLRAAIDEAYATIRRSVTRKKEKKRGKRH